MDIKMDTLNVEFPDDFEEFRQRANSGGSLYGIFRRRVISSGVGGPNQNGAIKDQKVQRPIMKPFKRQRSRSLITCSPTLADEKYVLLALFDYAEAKRHQTEIRRHSTAVDGRDLRKVVLTNSLNRSMNLRPPELGGDPARGSDNFLRPDSFITPQPPTTRKNSTTIIVPNTQRKSSISIQVPPVSRKNSLVINAPGSRKNSMVAMDTSGPPGGGSGGGIINPSLLSNIIPGLHVPSVAVRRYSLPRVMLSGVGDSGGGGGGGGGGEDGGGGADEQQGVTMMEELLMPAEEVAIPPPGGVNMSRRRSFTITAEGIKNQGDIIIQPPASPSFVSMASQQQSSVTMDTPPSPDPLNSPDNNEFVLSIPVPTLNINTAPNNLAKSDSVDSVIDSAEFMRDETSVHAPPIEEMHMCSVDDSEETWVDVPVYRVLTLGGPGVGKTALTQQFMTSEYMAAQNTSFDDGIECCVPVLLDGEEYIMEFIDLPYTGNNIWKDYEVDAYLVVFSITDRRSFQKADDFVYDIRKEGHTSEAVIIVANKSDLVRGRLVAEEEARQLADNYDCKFIEVSAILNHKVDDLLVGILKQIRLNYEATQPVTTDTGEVDGGGGGPRCSSRCVDDSGCMTRTKDTVLGKFFKPRLSRSCENLLDL